MVGGRQPLVEDHLRWKTTLGGRQPWWKMTFGGRQPSVKDDLWWKATFGGRWPLVEKHLRWKLQSVLKKSLQCFSALYLWQEMVPILLERASSSCSFWIQTFIRRIQGCWDMHKIVWYIFWWFDEPKRNKKKKKTNNFMVQKYFDKKQKVTRRFLGSMLPRYMPLSIRFVCMFCMSKKNSSHF